MDLKTMLSQFDHCAQMGTALPDGVGRTERESAAIAYEWLMNKAQAQFVATYELIAEKAFDLPKASEVAPTIKGRPYGRDIVMFFETRAPDGDERFHGLIVDIHRHSANRDIHMGEIAGDDGRPAVMLQFSPHAMYRATLEIIQERGLLGDDDILLHTNALLHILGRTGEREFTPAKDLH